MAAPCREDESQAVIAEAEYLLRRWCIVVSARGAVHARPTSDAISIGEVAAFLALCRATCDETFPRVFLLDFEGTRSIGEEWTPLASLIAGFAEAAGLACRMISGRSHPLSAACLFRHPHV